MLRAFSVVVLLLVCNHAFAQRDKTYIDSIKAFQKAYVDSHEIVKTPDKKYFRFFAADKKFRIVSSFTRLKDHTGFIMKTSGNANGKYFRYGVLDFMIDGKALRLTVYQSEALMSTNAYKDYLFVPYTDLTSGNESYGGGKYLEFRFSDIKNGHVAIDFNKAYNPYCAYATGFNCPVPPRENDLPVAIPAGEKTFGKAHQ